MKKIKIGQGVVITVTETATPPCYNTAKPTSFETPRRTYDWEILPFHTSAAESALSAVKGVSFFFAYFPEGMKFYITVSGTAAATAIRQWVSRIFSAARPFAFEKGQFPV
ncbi:hypothetical protein [Paenibacillus rhizophilus]|uniref:Uncharacterized protein n=1 Tax=Paenibacillus rhizophilus TaxID=1850366 RepID=A0A3N9P631_9BACL|nr:hypothetical protein [Paenibacillus rhizophilus]RQW11681.1 hypothetical protein EH198_11775 [Paenibacillus rhizophilus]